MRTKAGIPRRRHRHRHSREDLRRLARHSDIAAKILARMSAKMSVSVSVSWNAGLMLQSYWQRSACVSVTTVSPAKTAEPIEMPFGMSTPVGPSNHVLLMWVQISNGKREILGKIRLVKSTGPLPLTFCCTVRGKID